MHPSSLSVLVALLSSTIFALPNQSHLTSGRQTRKVMLSDLKESTLVPVGCFCAAGSLCCRVEEDVNCDYGVCDVGA